jgi:Tol biopolymer transport system component
MKIDRAKILISLLISITCVMNANSQRGSKFSDWTQVTPLPPPINSEYDDQAAVLSKDEKTMYFSSNRPGSMNGSKDIWVSTRKSKESGWRTPQNLGPNINSAGTELVRSLTTDGRFLLFQSDRDGGNGSADIWVIARKRVNDDFAWGEPVNLGSAINTQYQELASSYLFANSGQTRKLFFSSNKPGGFGGPDIYESEITDQGFGTSVNVLELNSSSVETCFWVRDDGLEIVFSSNRPDLNEDRSFDDLWTAHRESIFQTWSAPVRLGPNVNARGYQDVAPFVTANGQTMLMSSKRPGGLGPGTFDIYITHREKKAGRSE